MSTKTRKMLSDWQASYIQELIAQIDTQSKQTLAKWAVDYAWREILPLWSKHFPRDERPQNALQAAREWLTGTIKLPQAKPIILQCHAAARETGDNPVAQAAARAIGQCASTIHSAQHCIGLAFYGALAIAYDTLGTKAPWEEIEAFSAGECVKMLDALKTESIHGAPNPARIKWHC